MSERVRMIALGLATLGSPISAPLGEVPPLPAGPAIVFMAHDSSGPSDLMVVSADGSNARVLLASADSDSIRSAHRWPRWSPDGRRVVFASRMPVAPPGHPELTDLGPGLYTIDSDGTSLCQVTKLRSIHNPYPAWSPLAPPGWSGSKILYADLVEDRPCGGRLCGQWDLFLVDAACGAAESLNLTRTPDRDELYAVWSPDGRRIAASVEQPSDGRRSRPSDIVVFDLSGSSLMEATSLARPAGCLSAIFPDWSRRGDRIAACCVGRDGVDLWVRSLEARSWDRLLPVGSSGMRPTWSPDDAEIAFEREDDASLTAVGAGWPGASRPVLAPAPGSRVRYIAPDWRRD